MNKQTEKWNKEDSKKDDPIPIRRAKVTIGFTLAEEQLTESDPPDGKVSKSAVFSEKGSKPKSNTTITRESILFSQTK